MKFISKKPRKFLFEIIFNKDVTPFMTTFKKGTKTYVSEIIKTKSGNDAYVTDGYGKVLAKHCEII